MHGTMRGEHIARKSARLYMRDLAGAKTLEGLLHPDVRLKPFKRMEAE